MYTTPTERRPFPKRLKAALVIVGVLAGTVALAGAAMVVRMNHVPADLNLGTTRTSNAGLFKASYRPSVTPIPVNRLHSWTLHLETPRGEPIEHALISVDGDMPQHGHGLPTHPVADTYLGHGDYLVEGLKYQMGGWWVMDYKVTFQNKTDTVRFNLMLR
ncbi:FixH family protein [Deinococcus pimensis]|uniref:FixH family protein n=1 Tax=Deinococcus pimensis TaxID=309888 RepID=UPI0004B0C361|nr:FixH family protein [Deinococcus pimensis]